MNPDWFLALAPAVGLGTFFLALCWPSERNLGTDGGHGLGVPDREIRPERRIPEDTQTDQETEEEQTMSEFSDKYHRSVALNKATKWATGTHPRPSADEILKVAEKFRAFLSGEKAGAVKADFLVQPANLMFGIKTEEHQPSWTYFKFRRSESIYYRADISKSAHDRGAVERKGYGTDKWTSNYSNGNPKTRAELRERDDDYVWVRRSEVPAHYLVG